MDYCFSLAFFFVQSSGLHRTNKPFSSKSHVFIELMRNVSRKIVKWRKWGGKYLLSVTGSTTTTNANANANANTKKVHENYTPLLSVFVMKSAYSRDGH